MKRERGFTLIELLVVIAILAVLFGLTALYLNNVGSNAKREAARAEADMVQTAIDVYMTVKSTSSISSPATCEKAGDSAGASGVDFDVYLRRATRFYFAWEDDGDVLTAYEEDTCTTQLWP